MQEQDKQPQIDDKWSAEIEVSTHGNQNFAVQVLDLQVKYILPESDILDTNIWQFAPLDKLIEWDKDDLRKSFNKMQQGHGGVKVSGVKPLDGRPYKRMKLTRPEFANTVSAANEATNLGGCFANRLSPCQRHDFGGKGHDFFSPREHTNLI